MSLESGCVAVAFTVRPTHAPTLCLRKRAQSDLDIEDEDEDEYDEDDEDEEGVS
jgi:hypothetical protein